mmetsp:Transcript_110497/g.191505  ORF Transcript_110497/g.191505 Transcript_110497/m.191505 type:complete len:265 (+) Transcript_110497:1110-1904(+)
MLLDTVWTEGTGSGEVGASRYHGVFTVAALHDTLLATHSLHQRNGKLSTGVCHGQGSRTRARLSLDHLVSTEHDAVRQGVTVFVTESEPRLREQRNDGLPGMTANHVDVDVLGCLTLVRADESLSAGDIQSGNTHNSLGVVATLSFQNLSGDGNSGVHGVRNDANHRLRARRRTGLNKSLDDTGIDVEQVVTGHTRLAGDTGRDDNHVAVLQSVQQFVTTILSLGEPRACAARANVAQVNRDTGSERCYVVQPQVTNKVTALQK